MNIPSYKSRNITILIIIAIIAIIIAVFMSKGNSVNQGASVYNAQPPLAENSYVWKKGECYYSWIDAQGNSQSKITDIASKRNCRAITVDPDLSMI